MSDITYKYKTQPESAVDIYNRIKAESAYRKQQKAQQEAQRQALAYARQQEAAALQEQAQQKAQEEQKNKGGFLGGLGYVGEQIGLGLLRGIEGIWDFAAGGIADLFGADKWAEKQVSNDWVNYNHANEWYNPGTGWEFAGQVGQGVGQMLPSIAVSAIPGAGPALGTGVFMAGAAGNSVADAYRTTGELGAKEWLYGTGSGILEGAIEKVSGGIGGTKLGTVLGKKVANSTAGKLATTFVGEGLEEVASDLIDPTLRRVTGVDPNAQVDVSQLPNTFLVGGTAGAVLGGASRVANAKRAGGFNNLNAAEAAQEIRSAQEKGDSLQAKGKLTESWAKTLGEKQAETAVKLSERLKKMTPESRSALIENNNLSYLFNEDGSMKEAPKATYNKDAYSYSLQGREEMLKYQPTTQALTDTQKAVVRNVEKMSGGKVKTVIAENLTADDGTKANALYKDGVMYIDWNANATEVEAVHEMTHSLEGTEAYNKYANFIFKEIQSRPELTKRYGEYLARYQATAEAYSGQTQNMDAQRARYVVQTELVSQYTADMFGNEEFIRRLSKSEPNVAQRLWQWIKDKIKVLTTKGGDRETIAFLQKAEKLYRKALSDSVGGVKLSELQFEDETETEKVTPARATPAEARYLLAKDDDSVYNGKKNGEIENGQERESGLRRVQSRGLDSRATGRSIRGVADLQKEFGGAAGKRISKHVAEVIASPKRIDKYTEEIAREHAKKIGYDLYFAKLIDSKKEYYRQGKYLFATEDITADDFGRILDRFDPVNRNTEAGKTAHISAERWKKFLDLHGDGDVFVAKIPIQDFLDLTADRLAQRDIREQTAPLDVSDLKASDQLYLKIDFESGKVLDHEGRHRLTALLNAGYQNADVMILAENAEQSQFDKLIVLPQESAGEKPIALFNLVSATDPAYKDFATFQYQKVWDKDIRYSLSIKDNEYLAAVERGDAETAQKIVDEIAKEVGYTDEIYHGTEKFGFTEFNPKLGDDGISIFASSDLSIAKSYGAKLRRRAISEKINIPNNDKLIELLKENGFEDIVLLEKGKMSQRKLYAEKSLASAVDAVKKGLNQEDQYEKGLSDDFALYAREFKENSDRKTVLEFLELADRLSSEYSIWHKSVSDLRLALQICSRLNEDIFFSYNDEIALNKEEAVDRVINVNGGIYKLYGKPGKRLNVNGNGENWNNIPTWLMPMTANTVKGEANLETKKIMLEDNGGVFFETDLTSFSRIEGDVYNALERRYGKVLSTSIFNKIKDGFKNSSVVEAEVKTFGRYTTREISRFAKENGYDSVLIKNINDNGGRSDEQVNTGDVYIYFNSNRVKSADTVVYDDEGKIIPLSKRFDESKNDIRYSLPIKDSEGRELTPEQREFFRNSKVVDENGKLRPVYHGTLSQEVRETWNAESNSFDVTRRDFTVFKRSADDENIGFFFASDYDNAGGYGSKVYSVYLNLTSPLVIDCNNADYSEIGYDGQVKDTYDWAKWAKKKGYDGVIFKNIRDGVGYEYMQQSLDEYVAFKSNQIKLTTNKTPTSDADIRYSLKPDGTKILTEIPVSEQTRKEKARDLWTNFQVHFSDEQAGVVKTGKKLGVADIDAKTHFARAAYNAAGSMLDEYQTDRSGNKVGDGFKAIWDPVYAKGDTYRHDFYEYLLQHQNIDRLAQGKEVFADTSAEDSKKDIAELAEKHPEFPELAKKVWKYSDNLLQLRVDMGLISQEAADAMREMYPHYVPTFRDMKGTQGVGGLSGKYNLAVKTTIKTAKGSTLDILPPDVIIARQTMEVMRAGRVNELIRSLYDAAEAKGEFTDLSVVERKLQYRKAEQNAAENAEAGDELYELLETDYSRSDNKNNQVTFFKDGERITLAVTPEVFAGIDSYSPNVEYRNKLIEAVAKGNNTFKKLVTSANPFFLVRNFLRDLQEALFYSKHGTRRFFAAMGKAYKQIATNGELWQKYKALGGLSSGLFDYNTGVKRETGIKARAQGVLGKLEWANMFIEQAPRLAEFMLSVEKGATAEQALLDSADVTTNFSRGGKTAKFLNRTVMPFLNPSIQGWSKLVRTIFSKKSATEWGKLILKALILGVGLTALNYLLNGDDDDYKALSMRDKENYYLFKVGDTFLKLPKGRVLSVFGSLYLRGKESAEGNANAWDGYLSSVASQVSPVDNMTRTIFSPLTDAATNTTWYGGQIEGRKFDNTAPKDRYDESTSSIAIALGKLLNYSPKKIHYVIDQYSGIIGDIVLPMTTKKAERGVFLSNFTVDPALNNRWSNDFYTALDEANYAKTAGDLNSAYVVRYLNSVAGEVSDMYATKQQIEASDKAKGDKASESKAIQLLINETQKKAVEGVKKFQTELTKINPAEAIERLKKSAAYREFGTLGQEKSLQRLNDYYYAVALNKAFGTELEEKYQLYSLFDDSVFAYLTAISTFESDKDEDGNTIAGSRKKKVFAYINKLPISAAQKYVLMGLAGYKNEKGQSQVESLIRSKVKDRNAATALLVASGY